MQKFYITNGNLLVSYGANPVNSPRPPISDTLSYIVGEPEGFTYESPPYAGALWDVVEKVWVDTREPTQVNTYNAFQVLATRKSEYPPIEDFADAMYWNSRGDSSKLTAYYDKITEVKKNNPKS